MKGRLRTSGQAILAARDEIEGELDRHGYLSEAPFQTVSLILRYGDRDDLNPDFGSIDKRNSELPVTVQLDLARLQKLSPEQLILELRTVMIDVLCDVAANFDLPFDFLDAMRTSRSSSGAAG